MKATGAMQTFGCEVNSRPRGAGMIGRAADVAGRLRVSGARPVREVSELDEFAALRSP